MKHLLLANVLLAFAWAAITGTFSLSNLLFGFLLGMGALFLIREQLGTETYFLRMRKLIGLGLLFVYELVLSSVRVAYLICQKSSKLSPGIVAFPLRVTTDAQITVLASLITLTPGTLSLDVSDDRRFLFIHCIDVPDPEALIAGLQSGFEQRILEASE